MAEDDPVSWMDSLHAFPELAQQVGQFTAAFASLEHLIRSFYSLAVGGKREYPAVALPDHIDSFAMKTTDIEKFYPLFFYIFFTTRGSP
jgi:hypothetical protein